MTFVEKDGGLEWTNIQYRVDGSTPKQGHLILIDGMDHTSPDNTDATYNARWLDSNTLDRVYRFKGRIVAITIDILMPDGKTLMQFTHSFNRDGSFRNDETQIWHRHVN